MKNSFAKKLLSIVLASSMLASTPGHVIAEEDLTFLAQESTESGGFGAASEGSEFTDPVPASVPEVPAASEEPAAAADSPADFSDSGSSETAGTDAAAQAAAVDSSAEAAAIQPETAAAAVSSEQGGYTDSAEPASLPGMEDEIAVDSDSSEGFVEENLTERTLDVQMYTQRLYEQQNVPTHELKTVNELWQWLFARNPEPNTNPSQDALNIQIKGYLPEDVTASAGFMLFDEEDTYPETAIASIDVSLVRADGSEYLPEAPLDLIVSGRPIGQAIAKGDPYFIVYAHDEYNAMESLIVDESEFTSDVTVFRALPENAQEAQNEYWTKTASLLSYQTATDHERISFTEDPDGLRTNRSKKRIRFELKEGQPLSFVISVLNTAEETLEETELTDDSASLFESEALTEAIQIIDTGTQTEATQEIETETEAAQAVETEIQTEVAQAVETEIQTDAAQAVETEIQTEAAQAAETEIQTESAQTIETETQTEAASEAETAAQTEAAVEPETAAETEAAPETEAPAVVPESEAETEISAAETETESEAFLKTEEETKTEEEQSETEAETELTEEELLNRSLRVRTQDGALVSVSGLMPADVSAQVLSEDADVYSEDLEGQGVLALDISLNRETGEVNAPEAGAEAVKNEDSADAQTAGTDFADTGSTGDSDPSAQAEEESSSTVEADNSIAYQPQEPVRVIITDSSIGEAARENAELEVWHIADDGTSTKVENVRFVGNSAIFYADRFSVYVITYTVDFHFGDYTWSMEGASETLLSALLDELGVTEITAADVTGVSFSNPEYLEIEQADNDWLLKSLAPFTTEEALILTLSNGQSVEIKVTDEQEDPAQNEQEPAADNGTEAEVSLTREFLTLDGSWAYWRVTVNPDGAAAGSALTLLDTFDDGVDGDAGQSIDYSSVQVSGGSATYDYSGSTGTFAIPDATPVTITYRTRITAEPGDECTFRGTAILQDAEGNEIARSTAGQTDPVEIYPSASEVSGDSDYMLKLFVYANGAMQTGIPGAQFILLDANQRALQYKEGDNKGEPVTFTTDENGYANVELNEEDGDVAIEKNTGYYLEMIQAVDGYQKDNTLYGFMITDDPAYSSGGFWKYYNGDTMKVRLHPASGGLSVSIRFSGSYTMSTEQQNAVTAILQKKDEVNDTWVEVERHPYTDMENGAIKFNKVLYDETLGEVQNIYRVVEENQSPWDLPDDIVLDTTYYCLINSGSSDPHTEPQTFFVGNANDSVSVVIDNRYEEPQLTIVKMDKKTGEVLPGAEFLVYEIVNAETSGEAVKTYTTDADGELVIMGGEPFESEKLYGIKETKAPEHYLLPLEAEWHYFYFCNDEYLEPRILANLPEGATAVNLTKGGDRITIDNQKETIDIPVMKIWQGSSWPDETQVVVGLYKSVAGEEASQVLDGENNPLTVTLTKANPYNNKAFTGLPSRDSENRTIKYTIKEESINGQNPLEAGYVQEYGTSSAGVYIVRNKPATTLTVNKEWYDLSGGKVTDSALLAEQSDVTLDIYRSTTKISDEIRAEGITNAEMTTFIGTLTKVRSDLSFGAADNWTMSASDLDAQDDLGNRYYYYVLETVPSFGNELYEADEDNGTVTIQNKIAPQRVSLTVTKGELVEDPRPDSLNRDFEFTLKLAVDDTHPVRSWAVYTDDEHPENNLITDRNGEVKFTLKPTNPEQSPTEGASITLSLPAGVTAAVTEAYDPEYRVSTAAAVSGETADDGRTFTYQTDENTAGVDLTYTNTLRVICKVVKDDGTQVPFESLNRALAYIRENSDSFTNPWVIYMLEDYTILAKDVISIAEGESLRLTTASKTDSMFPFVPPTEETDRDFAVITRGEAGGSMLTNAGTLTLEKICLDGGNGNGITASGDGGLVNSTGTLNLNAGTILRNSTAEGKGGAVYAEGTVNIDDTVAITGNSASSASALYLKGTLNMTGGSISENTGAADGAVVVENASDKVNLSGNAVISENTNKQKKAANLYIGADSDNIVNVVAPGLAGEAQIGITAMEGHMLIGEQFAMAEYEQTANLNRFTNDVYGYRGKLKEGTSTNIVWDGLTLKIRKKFDGAGTNPNDRFTITLSSPSIMMSTYIINGTLDYTVTPASGNSPGRIVFRNVKAGDEYTLTPLPVGNYTITEAASNYSPSYSIAETGSTEDPAVIPAGTFTAENDSMITVTNTRKTADVNLTKTLVDRLKSADETQEFDFSIKLADADGTALSGFTLAENIITDVSGVTTLKLSPQNYNEKGVTEVLQAPVGATMTITEANDSSYRVTASAKTMPSEGEGEDIEDEDTADENVLTFSVTDDGAAVLFTNERKVSEIILSKTLVGKVSRTESFEFTVTLTREDGNPAANYTMYEDAEDPEDNITTDNDGKAVIPFTFAENESFKSVALTIPEGTKLEVEESNVNGHPDWYDTTYSLNGAAAQAGVTAEISSVSGSDSSIAFTNTRKTQTVTVTNTVSGYSGNVVPFTFTATVTDGGENDYDANGFENGVQTFELATGQSKTLTVPYGATLTVAETFIVGYGTTVKRGGAAAVEKLSDTFVVTADINPLLFTNSQLIGLRIVNNTSSTLENVTVTVDKNNIYLINEDQTGQERISSNKTATISVAAGKTAILEIQHNTSATAEQNYSVKGITPADGYYYTINNEPSFHETANPAILRVYNTANYEVKGKLRYSVNDSTVTFTEQPLVSFDSNGGSWTTEMDGYRDRDGDRKVYQKAVDSGETVARPTPDPVYPTAEGIPFLGWTTDEAFAKQAHTASEDVSAKLYDFANTSVTAPCTLYAIWARDPNVRTVTVKNGLITELTVTVTLTNDDPSGANYTLYEDTVDSFNNITTDASGMATFTLAANETRNLHVPNGAKLVISGSDGIAYSTDYTDTDSVPASFTIDKVQNDGTVAFIGGIFKITDADGNLLYDENGRPAVYGNLRKINNADPDEAFDAYEKTLYTDASHTTEATPAAVKQLVDEYTIPNTAAIAFPNKTMTLTTAGKDDADFPYVGVRDRATIYRSTAGANANCFTLASGSITLTDIILDGGSEQGVKVAAGKHGGLINMTNGTLNVSTGTTLRNVVYANYNTVSYGGAIYMNKGTLNVSAGLFSNLHACQGGAIYAITNAQVSIEGTDIRFENCCTEATGDGDGGAIYYNDKVNALTINGGQDKDNPGIVFDSCVAKGKTGSGGAIYVNTTSSQPVSISGCSFIECSAREETNTNAAYGGGGICADGVSAVTVSYCSFTACDTLSRGGGVVAYVANKGEVSVNHSTFERCNCKGQGGGMAVYQPNQENSSVPKETDACALTKLSVNGCEFSNCSSGTNNGSGGAIQCYLPRMEFTDSTFTDCWAGKEGGAVNNYFGNGYTVVWPGTYMNMTGCTFIRCRAEDRYQAEQPQHYGGAVNTKVKTVTVSNSYFEDCVSTLREGGALHLGGQGGGSKAAITGSTFKNCTAKTCGGAVLASTETLEVSESFFYGCQTSGVPAANYVYNNNNKKNQNGGGAISHSENSRGTSTQKTTLITNCFFAADPDGGTDALSCSTATNGGAIWTRATTDVKLENLTIENATAGNYGGGVYLDTGVTKATITDGSIKECQAVSGSAVYVGKNATFSGDLEVSGNTVSDVNSGAIQTVNTGKLYFEGNVLVKQNTCSADSTYNHDVLMQINGNTIINTSSVGLDSGASIGVYVSDPNSAYANRGLEGQAFGTYGSSNYLDAFFNNRNGELYGCQMSADDTKIYWGNYVCKITDADGNTLTRPNGRDAVYQRLSQALDEFTLVTGGSAVYIKMLIEDYTIRQTAAISNFPNAKITLTTAATSDAEHPYRGTEGTVCTISRTSGTEQLFKLNNADAVFQLEGITLDGRNDKSTETGNRRLIEAAQGALVINGGTTLQYGAASNGGAIDAAAAAQVTVNGVYDSASKEPTVRFINCTGTGNNKPNGGAIRAYNLNITNSSEETGEFGTAFINCSAYNGGAITSLGSSMEINGVFFDACQTQSAGGAVYHNYSDANSTSTFKNCAFENCVTNGNTTLAHGGAIEARTAELSVEDCSFKNCSATSDGGAVYHGYVDGNNRPSGNREKTTIKNTTFDGCSTTGSDTAYNYGGSVYTQAKTVEVIDSSFKDSTSANHGGALYCQSSVDGSEATISGTSFENCVSTRNVGCGGAIYSRNLALTLQKSTNTETTISGCTAQSYSGAVYMETSDSNLSITDGTVISGCYADEGGAIYLKSGVTMNLTGSDTDGPEFTQNGYATLNGSNVNATNGACIYLAEGGKLKLSGNLKFSRNNLPYVARIINGGVLDFVRQDIYLAGYSGKSAESIVVTDDLTGDTIWVWPEQSPHRLPNEQFAKVANGVPVSADTLSHFRNSLADDVTGCANSEYLAGVKIGNDEQNIYWDKMYVVSFKKIDNKGVAVPGAGFTLYNDPACGDENKVAEASSADGVSDTDASGNLLAKGMVEFPSIQIGAYYMKETLVPSSFKENDTIYLVLVGTPYLSPHDYNKELWENDGPLDEEGAANLVVHHTTDAGKYYGIFPLNANNKADLRANLASSSVGIENIRNDYQVSFMKVDGSGNPLPGAAFTIYTVINDASGQPRTFEDGYPALTRWSRDGENYPAPVLSADGTSTFKDVDNNTLPKGMVYFRELPLGTYYLLETEYPERNGDGRLAFYAETDRVFKLDIEEDEKAEADGQIKVTLSEWKPTVVDNSSTEDDSSAEAKPPIYEELTKNEGGFYTVSNQEVVCKLTDAEDNLLYVKGHSVWERDSVGNGTVRLFPAVYPTLEEGFAAAQNGSFVDKDGQPVSKEKLKQNGLKLKVLKDFIIKEPIIYNSERPITFTTAEKQPSEDDRYVFSTTRTSDTSRAEIRRAYSEGANSESKKTEALITVAKGTGDQGASFTMQNIKLNGQKASEYTGRAIHVVNGSLTIQNNVLLQNFKHEAALISETGSGTSTEGEKSVRGGAVLMKNDTTLTIDGGKNRTAIFSDNEVGNTTDSAFGGAIEISKDCTVEIQNVQFIGNKVTASDGQTGNGGAVSISGANLTLTNAVFTSNTADANGSTASVNGGAVYVDADASVTLKGSTAISNSAVNGGSFYNAGTLNITDGTFNNNNAEYGAGIFNKSGTITVSGGSFRGNKAEGNGGVIYNETKDRGSLTISGGTFTGNTADKGGVLYLASNSSATINGGSISGNSSTEGGAVDVADGTAKLYFGGSPVIYNNYESGSTTQQKNVVLSADSNQVIYTTGEGLAEDAKIGVYTPKVKIEGKDTTLYSEHGVASMPFGTYQGAANLKSFVNDWAAYQYGATESNDDEKIYWADPIARVSVDEGTTWTYFAWLINQEVDRSTQAPRGAFDYANKQTGDVIIELLKDAPKPETVERYALQKTFEFTEGKNIELRTTQDEVFNPGTEKFTSVLWRGADYGSMLKSSAGSLSLENVILDGNKAHFSSSEDGGLIYVNGGSLTVHSGVELRNSLTGGSGGAVYLNGGSFTMEAGSTITGNSAANGAAVLLAEDAAFTMQGGSIVSNASVTEDVTGAVGGAVTMTKDAAKVVFSGDPIVYGNFNSAGYQQNVVLQHDSNAMIHAKGLTHSGNSIIGIYVAGEEAGTLFTNHGKEGMNFGTYDSGDTDKLSVFINDRKVKLTGCISEDGSYVRWTAEGPTAVAVSKVWKEEGVAAAEEDVENLRVYFELKKVSGGAGGDTHGTSLPGEMVTSFEIAWPTALAAEVIRNHDQSQEIPMTVSNGFFWVDELNAFYIIVKNSNVGSTHFVDHPTNSTEEVLKLLIDQNNAVKFSGEFINYDLYKSTGEFDTKYFTWKNNDWWPTSEVNYGDVVLYGGTYYVVWTPNGSPLDGWKDGTTGSGNNWFSIQPGSAGGSSGSANLKIAYTTQKQAEEEEGSLADDGYTVSSVKSSDASQHSAVTTDYTHTNKDGTTETWHLFSIDTSDEDWTKIITNLESNASYYVVERRITRIEDKKDEDGNVVTDEDGNPVKVEVDLPLSNYSISYAYSQDGGSAVITNDSVQSTGVEVGFRKIGSDGVYLPGAAFALYESYQDAEENNITKRVSVTGESGFVDETTNMVLAYSGASGQPSGGNNASAAAGQTTTAAAVAVNTDPTPNGAVKFKVSEGVYFMREVTTPAGYEQDDSIYLVLAGASNMTYAELSAEVKEYFTNSAWISASADGIPAASQRLIDAQNNANASAASIGEAGGEEPETPYPDKGYAIFRLQKTEGTGSTRVSITEGSDVTNNGLMNVKTASRKVILKKTDGAFTPLPGAVFTLYNVDWTKRDETADHLAAQSGASGVFYINTLPFGRYYLEETQAPAGYGYNTGKYFILDVTEDGVVVTPNKQSGATTPFTRDQVISHDGTTKNKAILTVGGAGIASGGNGTGTNIGGGTGTDPGSGTQTQTKKITVQLSNSTDFGSNDSITVTINSVSKTLNSGTNSVEFDVEGDSGFAVSYTPSPDIQVKASDGTSEPQQTVAGGQTVSVKGVISKSITVQISDTSNMTDTDKVTVTVAGSSDGAVELTKTVSSHVFPISDGKQHAVTCVASEGISVTPASANLAGNNSVNLTVTRRADDGGNTDAGVTGSGDFVVHAAKSMYHAGDYVDLSLKAANGENWTLHEAKYNNMTVTFSDNTVAEITQNDGIYFKKAGTVTVTLTAGGDIYKSGILMFRQGETATITLSADSALPAASYSNLYLTNKWDGNKQYNITLANDSDVKVSSLTVTLKAIGSVSTIGGRVTGTVNSNTNTCTVTYTDSNGIAAGATVTVQMHITGTGEFSVAALT